MTYLPNELRGTELVARDTKFSVLNSEIYDGVRFVLDATDHPRGPLMLAYSVKFDGFGPCILTSFEEAVEFLRTHCGPEMIIGEYGHPPEELDPVEFKPIAMRARDLEELPEWEGL